MGMIASKAVQNQGWTHVHHLTAADRWAATQNLKQVGNQRMVYEQHPLLADCSNARFVPDGFEVFTPGD